MPKRTRDYHEFLLEQLTDPIFAAGYLNEARQDSQKMFLKALRNVAESRRMAVVAVEAGVNRESLYKTLSEDGNPRLATYDSVLSALGLDYDIKPKQQFIPLLSEPPSTAGTITASGSTTPGVIDQSETSEPSDHYHLTVMFSVNRTVQIPIENKNANLALAA